MVFSTIGTVITFFRAASTALRIASGTSPALPIAKPTFPLRSPTTTNALNENRLPPLTTFATRLMRTTDSSYPLLSRSRPPLRYCIKTPVRLHEPHRRALEHARDICNRLDRIRRAKYRQLLLSRQSQNRLSSRHRRSFSNLIHQPAFSLASRRRQRCVPWRHQ